MNTSNQLFKTVPILIIFTLLAACTASQKQYTAEHKLNDGARLVLEKSINVPASTSTIYIQDGSIKSYVETELYAPNCVLSLTDISSAETIIKPDTFIAGNFYNYENPISWETVEYESLMSIKSPVNPQVSFLACQYQSGSYDTPLTILDIKNVLAGIFTLQE